LGIPAVSGAFAIGTPPAGDLASEVVTGSLKAVGPGSAHAFLGPFNVAVWGSINTSLATTAGSLSATLGIGTGITVAGAAVDSVNVPPGTTIATVSGTSVTLALPPGYTSANIVTGTDTAAIFTGAGITYSGTFNIERSFDGCNTWLPCNIGGAGTLAQFSVGTVVNVAFGEPELAVYYRVNCVVYSSGTINYRMSTNGARASSIQFGQLA
jgi:hypothetical protein